MATTTVSDAIVFPQSQGTGLSNELDEADATLLSALADHDQGEYVNTDILNGMSLTRDDANNEIDIASGVCYIRDDSTSTGGSRDGSGNPQGESSTTSGYDFSFPDHLYVVVLPTGATVSVSDATNSTIWINITDVTSNNSVEVRSDSGGGTTAAPSDTFIELVNNIADDGSASPNRDNDGPTSTVRAITDIDGDHLFGWLTDKVVPINDSMTLADASTDIQSAVDALNDSSDFRGKLLVSRDITVSDPITGLENKDIIGLNHNFGGSIKETNGSNDLIKQATTPPGNRDLQFTYFDGLTLHGNDRDARTGGSAIHLNDISTRGLNMGRVKIWGWGGPDPVIRIPSGNAPFDCTWEYVEIQNWDDSDAIGGSGGGDVGVLGTSGWCGILLLNSPNSTGLTGINVTDFDGQWSNIYGVGDNIGTILDTAGDFGDRFRIGYLHWENTGSNNPGFIARMDRSQYFQIDFARVNDGTVDDIIMLGDNTDSGVVGSGVIGRTAVDGDGTVNNAHVAIDKDNSAPGIWYHGSVDDVRKTSNAPATLTAPIYCWDGMVE